MVSHSRFRLRHGLFLLVLFCAINEYHRDATKSQPASKRHDSFRFSLSDFGWVLTDLDGDHKPDFAGGRCVGRTDDGYSYEVRLQLSSGAPTRPFTVSHNDALGLNITGVDIDGDDDIDLIISDRFFGQHIGIWLNDGKGRFAKSLPGRFSASSVSDLAFVAVDLNWAGQPTADKQQRRLPDYLAAGDIQPLRLRSSASNQHPVEWPFHFATDPLHQRAPPIPSAV